MVRCAAVALSLVMVLLSAGPAEAQYFGRNKVHYDRLDFRVLQTEHFDIYYYPEEEAATQLAARMAERWYARFSRLLEHTFSDRQPLVLYASHPHFSQTNVTSSTPGEGTGGLTERTKSRIAMPFAAGLGETDHVLGHEIAHAFQIDVAKRAGHDAFTLPGWFIEGMAEYLSLGPYTSHTMMWVRDAALHDRLPTLDELDDPQFFPYRFGHALWSYLAARHGDGVIGRVLRSRARGVLPRLEEVTGLDREQLTRDWHESILGEVEDMGERHGNPRRIASPDGRPGRIYVAPALSPDGRRLMYISEQDRLSLGVFLADAATGAVQRKVVSTATDPHFDSLQYIHSSGAWDAAGERFAMIAVSGGGPVLVVLDSQNDDEPREIPLDDLGEAYNPSWSPDGTRIVFSGLQGGLSDLFIYTLATGELRQLTADVWADLHPAWSPDGRTIALATDRFTSDADALHFGPLRVGLLDLATGAIRPLADGAPMVKQVSPQWSPDGSAVYFVSDRDGVSNVYRVDLATRTLRQVTDVRGGVSGITATSPALAVAADAGTLAFSVYRNGAYEIRTIDAPDAAGEEPRLAAHTPPREGLVAALLHAPHTGLPEAQEYPSTVYEDSLRLESIAPPFVGAGIGGGLGGAVRASFGMSFADMLRDRQLHTLLRLSTNVEDIAGQIAYTNRRGQWNWGVFGGIAPSRFLGAHRAIAREGALVTRETAHLRYSNTWGGVSAHYHMSRTRRVELGAAVRRTGFAWETITRVIDATQQKTLSRSIEESSAGAPVYVGEVTMAFVHDTAVTGPTSPLLGQRMRVEVAPAFGSLTYADVLVDARRYVMPVRPVTIAVRAAHSGRYGTDAGDPRLSPLVLGLETLVRGYTGRSFIVGECGLSATSCSPIEELSGSRLALASVELRAPLLGLLTGDLSYGRVPIELMAYADAGFLWTRRGTGTGPAELDHLRSVGAGGRVNLGGIVLEMSAARPFDRASTGWTWSLLMRPGW